jgi:hypothetical protein
VLRADYRGDLFNYQISHDGGFQFSVFS